MKTLLVLLFICSVFLTACGSLTPDPEERVRLAVQATLRAIPAAAVTAKPLPPLPSTATPATLSGLFCEYQFCIGHPPEMAFSDMVAVENRVSPSSLSHGILAAYNPGLFIELIWQDAPGITDPQFMLDLIMQSGGDTRNGTVEPKVMGSLNVFYVPITPTSGAATTLPYGGAAAWTCGGRAFAWMTYTPQPELAVSLLNAALSRFRCESH